MNTKQSLRVHNAMVAERMRNKLNRLRTAKRIGRMPGLDVREDRNALAFHYIESGAIRRFSAMHKIVSKQVWN